MQAIVRDTYGTPAVLRLQELPTPEPAAGEVRIRLRAVVEGTLPLEETAEALRRVGAGDVLGKLVVTP